jgi:hypothetical protein
LPIFRFDILELGLNYALDSAVFAVKMLQAAGQHHPRLLFSARTIQACDLFRQRLLDKLLERAPPLPRGSGFCSAKERFWNFECCFNQRSSPIFTGSVKEPSPRFFVAWFSSVWSFLFVSSSVKSAQAGVVATAFRVTSRWFPFCTPVNGQK